MIDAAVAPLLADPGARDEHAAQAGSTTPPSGTIRTSPRSSSTSSDFALYFSRAPIPFTRAGCPPAPAWRAHRALRLSPRRRCCAWRALPPTAIERAEALEQLRALEHGIRIKCVETTHRDHRRRHAADLERVRALAWPRTALRQLTQEHRTRMTDMPRTTSPRSSERPGPSNTSSSPAASCRRSARASRRRRSARCSKGTATRSRCRSSTRTSTSIRAR